MFFSAEDMEQARVKVAEDQLKLQIQQNQKTLDQLDRNKYNIRKSLAIHGDLCLPIRDDSIEKPLICSWFAKNGFTCDKDVFVRVESGYDTWCWFASLKKPSETFWDRFKNK